MIKYALLLLTILLNSCVVRNIQKNTDYFPNGQENLGYIIGSFYYPKRNSAIRLAIELLNKKTNEEYLIELRRPSEYHGLEVYPFPPGEYVISNFVRLSGIGELNSKLEVWVIEIRKPFRAEKNHIVYIGHYEGKLKRDYASVFLLQSEYARDRQTIKIYTIDKKDLISKIMSQFSHADIDFIDTPFSLINETQYDDVYPW